MLTASKSSSSLLIKKKKKVCLLAPIRRYLLFRYCRGEKKTKR